MSSSSSAWDLMVALARPATSAADLEAKVSVLTELVLDLATEVEALRSERQLAARAAGVADRETAYAAAYRETALLAHNSAGVGGGMTKILARFYGARSADQQHGARAMREIVLLRRLGFSEPEIAQFVHDASEAETRT